MNTHNNQEKQHYSVDKKGKASGVFPANKKNQKASDLNRERGNSSEQKKNQPSQNQSDQNQSERMRNVQGTGKEDQYDERNKGKNTDFEKDKKSGRAMQGETAEDSSRGKAGTTH